MVVDASVWVCWLISRDEHHDTCRRWLEEQARAGIALSIPSIATVEIASAVARRVRVASIGRRACARVMSLPRLRIYDLPFGRAMKAVELADATFLRGADLLYVQLALEIGAPLVTLDRQLADRGASVVRTQLLSGQSI